MQTMMKRKRGAEDHAGPVSAMKSRKPKTQGKSLGDSKKKSTPTPITTKKPDAKQEQEEEDISKTATTPWTAETTTIQVITGSYERVLHGLTATIPTSLVTGPSTTTTTPNSNPEVTFTDTFLFNAHASSIRCLALSPPPTHPHGRILLATGSTDERINIYSLSTSPPPLPSKPNNKKPTLPTLHSTSISSTSKNKELGSLLHHSSSITALHFPTRAKLLSAAEDSTIAITRTRDWEPLTTIKAPIPKPAGRPSGDTAGPGEIPAGVSDFAVHPSMKLMLSVGRGEKCMRLWNLVTGKKAGVLSFGRDILAKVGEGRFGAGEGRRVVWDEGGEEFAVAFERGVAVFGVDCLMKRFVVPGPRTKVHQVMYLPQTGGENNILALSTEDGRIMFYQTNANANASEKEQEQEEATPAPLLAQLAGPATGLTSRIKAFEIIPIPSGKFLIVTGSSDGSIRFWVISASELTADAKASKEDKEGEGGKGGEEGMEGDGKGFEAKQVGRLIAMRSTGTRITCLKAFVMTGLPEEENAEEAVEGAEKSENSSDEEDDSE